MTEPTTVIRDNKTLHNKYLQLKKNDIICGRVRLHPGEESLLISLVERGVRLSPSGTSQLASRSKVFQTQLFNDLMVDYTTVVFNRHDLLQAITSLNRRGVTKVVLKQDRKNGGLGIHLFDSIESLSNQVCFGAVPYPFVVQPLIRNGRDVRVIILGDYVEAYERHNPYNFRNNLHCGADAEPFSLDESTLDFCRMAMERGCFPYAHIDLFFTDELKYRLLEINLRGGLRGAKLTGREYEEKTSVIHEQMVENWLRS